MTHLIDRDEVMKTLKKSLKSRKENDSSWQHWLWVEFALKWFIEYIESLPLQQDIVKEVIENKCKEYFELHVQNNINEEQQIRWLQLQELLNELYP